MMKSLPGAALTLTLVLGFGGAAFEPAHAGDWHIGGGFRVGGAHFSLAFDRGYRHHRPHYYYRTKHSIRYDGYRCGSYCLKRSSYTYHHAGCPLVLHHFRRNHFHPARVWDYVRGSARRHRDYYGDRYYSRRGHSDYYGHDYDHDSDSDSDSDSDY